MHSADFRLGQDPGPRERRTMWVYRFAQKQTRLRNVDTDTHCLLVEGPLNISWYLQAFEDSTGNSESMTKVVFHPLLRSILHSLEGVIQCLGSLRGKCSFQSELVASCFLFSSCTCNVTCERAGFCLQKW